jgi:hypothetical protein
MLSIPRPRGRPLDMARPKLGEPSLCDLILEVAATLGDFTGGQVADALSHRRRKSVTGLCHALASSNRIHVIGETFVASQTMHVYRFGPKPEGLAVRLTRRRAEQPRESEDLRRADMKWRARIRDPRAFARLSVDDVAFIRSTSWREN